MQELNIVVISDSTGETGDQVAKSLVSQFPDVDYKITRKSHVVTKEQVDLIFEELGDHCILIVSIVIEDLRLYILKKAKEDDHEVIDMLGEPLRRFEEITGERALRKPGLIRELDDNYFNKIEAIEFAVKYDDGKDKRGLVQADIVLIGVSRTSKTPLSLLLANKNYKVANLPLVPEIELPEEIYKVDPKRIIGLIIDPEKLNEIRQERLKALGLKDVSTYADEDRIKEELEYAKRVFEKLGCEVIDVSEMTVEQTATLVVQIMKRHFEE